MKLSIITINWNNAEGLRKTMESVLSQSCQKFEYLVVDGGSTDGSVEVIKHFDGTPNLRWVSERDKGIYNAMNKGIGMATGEYLQFLNSGDTLVDKDVVKKMLEEVEKNGHPEIMVGSLLYDDHGKIRKQNKINKGTTLWKFINSSINHPSSYIQRSLFERIGLYDESLKIIGDWKWFIQAVVFGEVEPVYVDVEVAIFAIDGISSTHLAEKDEEGERVLEELVPANILADYYYFKKDLKMIERAKRHKWAYNIMRLINRILFNIEKKKTRRSMK